MSARNTLSFHICRATEHSLAHTLTHILAHIRGYILAHTLANTRSHTHTRWHNTFGICLCRQPISLCKLARSSAPVSSLSLLSFPSPYFTLPSLQLSLLPLSCFGLPVCINFKIHLCIYLKLRPSFLPDSPRLAFCLLAYFYGHCH